MRLMILGWSLLLTFTQANAGYVNLNNVSHPFTNIEVGDTVSIVITGAASNGTITVVQNGGSPVAIGTTNSFGNQTITATETSAQYSVLPYTQTWYVNGVELSALNNSAGPTLPTFYVYANIDTDNCPSQSTYNSTRHWIWTPVIYDSTSTDIVTAASEWNYYVSDTIELSNDDSEYLDVFVTTGSLPSGVLGSTVTLGQDSNGACLDTLDACGNCMTPAVMYLATITLDSTQIANLAETYGLDDDGLTTMLAAHEFGHALRLSDTETINGICSEVQSIMYQGALDAYECGVNLVTPYCDGEVGIPSVYPDPVASYCSYPDPYCGHGACG